VGDVVTKPLNVIAVPRAMWILVLCFAFAGFAFLSAGTACAVYLVTVIAQRPDPVLLPPTPAPKVNKP
jgi:hypothetical protein